MLSRDFYVIPQALAAKKDLRPQCLNAWVGGGRRITGNRPAIPNLQEFATTFWQWWMAIQSDGRVVEEKLVQETGVNLTAVVQRGRNGIVTAVMALGWWGEKVSEGEEADLAEWLLAVADVSWVLEHRQPYVAGDRPNGRPPTNRAT